MRRALLPLLFALSAAAAQASPSLMHLFPASREPEASGRPVSVTVGAKPSDVVRLTPVIFLSKPGTNTPQEGSKSMCGVVIDAPGRPRQGLVTIGTGSSEATPSCDAVLAIGALPAARGLATRRIGVVHATSSRNSPDNREVAVLTRDLAGSWAVDDAATERIIYKMRTATIAEMRRLLR